MAKDPDVQRDVHRDCALPDDLTTPVWRYMDWRKFEWLIDRSALYLCRADRLQDKYEGTYTRRQIQRIDEWLLSKNLSEVARQEKVRRDAVRQRTYLSCWCVNDVDLDLMWKGYVPSEPGVALKSQISRLKDVCDQAIDLWPLDLSLVSYVDRAGGEHINYGGVIEPFIKKDIHYRLDNEIRIIHWPNYAGDPPPYVALPVILKGLIEAIFISPGAPDDFVAKIETKLAAAGLDAVPLFSSRDNYIE